MCIGGANNLTEDDVEGDKALHTLIVAAMRLQASQLNIRFKYLKALPWAFCLADTTDGAKRCLDSFFAIPRERHDLVTLNLMDRLQPHLEAMRDTGECSEFLSREVGLINTASLDESAGEGYHRCTMCSRGKIAVFEGLHALQGQHPLGQVLRAQAHREGEKCHPGRMAALQEVVADQPQETLAAQKD